MFLRKTCLLVVVRRLPAPLLRPLEFVLNLKRAGTTFAAESRASNVITHDATTMKPLYMKMKKKKDKVIKNYFGYDYNEGIYGIFCM